jgi:hypothetical protein
MLSSTPRRNTGRSAAIGLAALLALLGLTGCGTKHRLADYDYAGGALAILHVTPSSADLRLGAFNASDSDDPARALLAAGSRAAVEVEARRVRARLDSAAARVGVGPRMADRTADRATLYLGTRRVDAPGAADYVLDLRVRSFGVSAASWQSAARLYLTADVVLLHTSTGTEIWTTRVNGWDTLTPRVANAGAVPRDVITAAGLLTVSVEDLERALERVVDVSADAVTDELRGGLRHVRRPRD